MPKQQKEQSRIQLVADDDLPRLTLQRTLLSRVWIETAHVEEHRNDIVIVKDRNDLLNRAPLFLKVRNCLLIREDNSGPTMMVHYMNVVDSKFTDLEITATIGHKTAEEDAVVEQKIKFTRESATSDWERETFELEQEFHDKLEKGLWAFANGRRLLEHIIDGKEDLTSEISGPEPVVDPVKINDSEVSPKEWVPYLPILKFGGDHKTKEVKNKYHFANPKMDYLYPGNHFVIRRTKLGKLIGIEHHLLITEVDRTDERVAVSIIHMTGKSNKGLTGDIDQQNMVFSLQDSGWEVTECPSSFREYVDDLQGGKWGMVVDKFSEAMDADPALRKKTVENARRIMREGRKYSTCFYNCESFVMEAKSDVTSTKQGERCAGLTMKVQSGIIAVLTLALAVAAVVGAYMYRDRSRYF